MEYVGLLAPSGHLPLLPHPCPLLGPLYSIRVRHSGGGAARGQDQLLDGGGGHGGEETSTQGL